jgi:hypothetical protein
MGWYLLVHAFRQLNVNSPPCRNESRRHDEVRAPDGVTDVRGGWRDGCARRMAWRSARGYGPGGMSWPED